MFEGIPFKEDEPVSVVELAGNAVVRRHRAGIFKRVNIGPDGERQLVVQVEGNGVVRVPWPIPAHGRRKVIRPI